MYSQRYEHAYGNIGLFNDVHNFFPELLYDTALFQTSPVVRFFQDRVETLLPEDYVRHRTNYRLFQQEQRRQNFRARFAPPPPPVPPATQPQVYRFGTQQTPHTTHHTTHTPPLPATPRQRQSTLPTSLLSIPLRFTTPESANNESALDILLRSLLGTTDIQSALGVAELTADLTPVPVTPSANVLRTNTILTSLEPAADVMCAICQSHEQPTERDAQWRILRPCSHQFHRSCIDRWFSQHVHCPVCRHDIRESGNGNGNGGESRRPRGGSHDSYESTDGDS